MAEVKAENVLDGLEIFRNGVFTRESLEMAESAYLRLVEEGISQELHSTSNAAMERLVDSILAMDDLCQIREFLESQNPNFLAFLFIRIQHAIRTLERRAEIMLRVEAHPRLFVRWALVDFWNQSRWADDR